MATVSSSQRVHVGGQGTRMSRTCHKCKKPKAIVGGTCQPGKGFTCKDCRG